MKTIKEIKKMSLVTTNVINMDMNDEEFAKEIIACVGRHANNDFGDLSEEDVKANLKALKDDLKYDRVLSRYATSKGDIYVITEHRDGNSYLTTVLYCDEY